LSALLASVPDVTYVSMDLMSKRAMVRPEITRLSFPNRSFDVIYCSHVLEHVPDDTAAMRELRRVLRPSGWAILQAPVLREVT
jgi:ubiquinone/menaquinone biosynthesis C-methylase UbiE